jgi:hypothetical protein
LQIDYAKSKRKRQRPHDWTDGFYAGQEAAFGFAVKILAHRLGIASDADDHYLELRLRDAAGLPSDQLARDSALAEITQRQ